MKILKRNQLVILVISLMLVTAGYLNFTSNVAEQTDEKQVVAELGDATLVSSNNIVYEEDQSSITEEVNQTPEEETMIEENEATETIKEDTYFTTSKLERENIYSQTLETYQEIYNNTNSTSEQKTLAMNEIANINKTRNSIMIAENLVLAKGFEDIVIFANTNSISVIVKAESLQPEQIAQIQNIVSRELSVGAELISISTK